MPPKLPCGFICWEAGHWMAWASTPTYRVQTLQPLNEFYKPHGISIGVAQHSGTLWYLPPVLSQLIGTLPTLSPLMGSPTINRCLLSHPVHGW